MPRKILIVDDNAINRQMLVNVLCDNYDIIEAENGKEALILMHRNYKMLSAVLLDIVMPEMDGYDVLRSMRDNAMLAQIPVIMVTGAENEKARAKALSLGANDFILKPFSPEIVKHCLRNNIAMRENASIINAIQKDKLTGLYNREAFFEKAGTMIREHEPGFYILSCFDIDNFKLVNDQYGAVEGDNILREIGHMVGNSMGGMRGIAGRVSADNFTALFPAEHENTNVIKAIQEKMPSLLEQRYLAFSVGRYIVTDTALPVSAIYDRAYLAKQSVKGRFDKHVAYFDEGMLQDLIRDQQIVGDMEKALVEHQFETWFQPQYNHVTGAITGAEALVRWNHPQKGIISPGEFIPLFEQNGFVYEMDKYIWREVCRYLRSWLDKGLEPVPISVNISRYDIFRTDMIETITGFLEEYSIPIELLRLEITESAFAKTTNIIVDIVKKLQSKGFVIEIDDFGSGYSSLNTLKSVPAQVVKLDMRFLEDGNDEHKGGTILEAIVRMGKWLGMSVIAEGVETKEQGDFLKSIGCNNIQGFLYSRPMPPEEYEELFSKSKAEGELSTIEAVERFNNDEFWNPQSMDSLIFNSYVGSACIYEYGTGKIDLIRATDKYARIFGGEKMTVDLLMNLNIMDYLDMETARDTFKKIEASAVGMEEITGEFLFRNVPGCSGDVYTKSNMRVIATAENRHLVYCISENITAQREAERNERNVAKQLKIVMDNINCGITAVSVDGGKAKYLLANDKYYETLGYSREEFEKKFGDNALESIHEEDRKRVAGIIEHTRTTGEPSSIEYRIVRGDGKILWIRSLLSMTSFENFAGDVQLCTYSDITAERDTAQTLLDNLPCGAGICIINGDDAYVSYLNKRYFTYFKHNVGLGRSDSIFEIIHPDDRALLRETMRPAAQKGGEGSCVVRIMDGPGEYIQFRITGVALENEDRENAIYITVVPISHEELSFNEMLFVALDKMMSSSTDLSFVKDKSLKYICCSQAFAHMVGLGSEKDIFGKTDFDIFEEDLASQYIADDRKLMASGKSIIDMVESIPDEKGKARFSSTSKYLLTDSRGEIVGLYGTGHDITQIREAESQQKFLINNIPGGVAIYEGQWGSLESIKLSYFSDGFCEIFGYTREEYEELGIKNPTGLVVKEYLPGLIKQIEGLLKSNKPIDYIYRAKDKGDALRWIHVKGVLGERHGDDMTVNAVFFDVTSHQEALEQLRVSEEENRLAIKHSDNVVCKFNVADRTLKFSSGVKPMFGVESIIRDVPYGPVKEARISAETADVYIKFYEDILNGDKNGSAVFQRKSTEGWRWVEARSSTIFSSDKEPVSAVISFRDVTESFEKDVTYKKWLQTLHNSKPDSYSMFRCNISKRAVYDAVEGKLLRAKVKPHESGIDELFRNFIQQYVFDEDRAGLTRFINVDSMLEKYYSGERIIITEFRMKAQGNEYRWLRLTVDLVEYPHSNEIEAYLLFEDIDDAKRAELLTLERSKQDPLTGAYNRVTFAQQVNSSIKKAGPASKHALIMLDIDNFKVVNDTFGHNAGDQILIELVELLESVTRHDDFIGRLGGDEFLVFMNDIPNEDIVAQKASQICKLAKKAISAEVSISGSLGIAVSPYDGTNFDTLYKRADEALYYIKGSGKNNFAFYSEEMKGEHLTIEPDASGKDTNKIGARKRRMLIVDDNQIDNNMLANLFKDDFMVEKVKDGNSALIRMRHYGSAISVVLLDLIMPGIDGFAVLGEMQKSNELQAIPVVVVSGAGSPDTGLRAIKCGATDFVTKPVDPDILRIRVQSAISKADNEKLRAKNSFLELKNSETIRYKMVMEKIGIAVIEMDWGKGTFAYGHSISNVIRGTFDGRALWHILLSDMVASADTVKDIQVMVHGLADDRTKMEDCMIAKLKVPTGAKHDFHIHFYKITDQYGLTDKILMTFEDLEAIHTGH